MLCTRPSIYEMPHIFIERYFLFNGNLQNVLCAELGDIHFVKSFEYLGLMDIV